MLGNLSDHQIDQILQSLIIGRLGCRMDDKMYIIPVTYVFEDGYIYAHSKEGLKINIMRKNPKVCFQVDSIENMTNWRSVLVWGEFEELKSEEAQTEAIHILADRFAPYVTSETVKSSNNSNPPVLVEKELKAVIYRIKITEKSGRFEKS
ncbi:pyridoxamine 5'-phosphate oxidase family protein [Echinicola jeungdonensis]|uniref:Pyridoxamine 5'-phosphate oxidase family protein n=1 Tax=Echinicola jeungdonensis TaxID=709343 RepID=A0ABV5J974_9BACT|nr:pyridoxamine 5'-phosphate oxidase family protein [Echinicola jeungdonensis]MDN3670528.1 pyridoxamine 5'-phosphate oxidase family protein [Echinicola jeungdonensis]